jgi:hypothetical protein
VVFLHLPIKELHETDDVDGVARFALSRARTKVVVDEDLLAFFIYFFSFAHFSFVFSFFRSFSECRKTFSNVYESEQIFAEQASPGTAVEVPVAEDSRAGFAQASRVVIFGNEFGAAGASGLAHGAVLLQVDEAHAPLAQQAFQSGEVVADSLCTHFLGRVIRT